MDTELPSETQKKVHQVCHEGYKQWWEHLVGTWAKSPWVFLQSLPLFPFVHCNNMICSPSKMHLTWWSTHPHRLVPQRVDKDKWPSMNSGKIPTASSKRAWLQTSFPRVLPYIVCWEMPVRWKQPLRGSPNVFPKKWYLKWKKRCKKVKRKQTSVGTFKGLLPKMISWNHPSLATSPFTTKKTQDKTSPQRYLSQTLCCQPWRPRHLSGCSDLWSSGNHGCPRSSQSFGASHSSVKLLQSWGLAEIPLSPTQKFLMGCSDPLFMGHKRLSF